VIEEVSITAHVSVSVNRSPIRTCVVSVRHQHRIGAVSISPGRGAVCGICAAAAPAVRSRIAAAHRRVVAIVGVRVDVAQWEC
jgi:hypothetical protein